MNGLLPSIVLLPNGLLPLLAGRLPNRVAGVTPGRLSRAPNGLWLRSCVRSMPPAALALPEASIAGAAAPPMVSVAGAADILPAVEAPVAAAPLTEAAPVAALKMLSVPG